MTDLKLKTPVSQVIAAGMIVLSLLVLIGCSGEPDQREFGGERPDGNVYHPVADTIPYFDREHIPLRLGEALPDDNHLPEELVKFRDIIRDPDTYMGEPMDVLLRSNARAEYASVGPNRVIIHDLLDHRLHDYNLETHEVVKLNEHGEGPGDLQFTSQMDQHGTNIFVGMGDRRIAQFNCEPTPCTFHHQLTMPELAPASIAAISDSLIALMMGQGRAVAYEAFEEGLIRKVNMHEEDEFRSSFGKAYLSEVPIMRAQMVRDSDLIFLREADALVVMFPAIPILYVYDIEGSLRDTYDIRSFEPRFFEHDVSMNSSRMWGQDASRLISVHAIENGWALVTMFTTYEEGEEIRYDYYTIDVEEQSGYHVGAVESRNRENLHFVPTPHGIVRVTALELAFIPF